MTSSITTVRATPADPTRGRLRPLGLGEVRITGGFWAEKQAVNASASIAHIEGWMERVGWIANFDLSAAGGSGEGRGGREFSDSEVYKLLEAMAWEIGRDGDQALETRFRAIVARVAAAQAQDGYLNTHFGRAGQAPRWSDLEWGHELYCLGHLFQAAVARARTRPGSDDGLLEVARRAADLVCEVFSDNGIASVCGHAEVELALVELARVTGETRYLTQAKLFIERRGQGTLRDIEWGRVYYQDDLPIREATVLRGHSVRAGYLSAGAVDVAVEIGDDELLQALVAQWTNTVARRTYLTGGQGSLHQTEAFGEDWMLPPDRAYSETCAGVASVMFAWRLLLAVGGTHYADLIERTLYNVVATSPSHEGTSFFYANTLHQRVPGEEPAQDELCPRASSSLRAPWFAVSCCPPNVARTLASLAAYVATVDDDGLQLHQYVAAEIRTTLADGRRVGLDIETAYPREGVIRVTVAETASAPWSLTLRVPDWGRGASLVEHPVDGKPMSREVGPGEVALRRAFQAGDVIELHLPVAPRFTAPDPRIDAVRGCLAVERGPEVMCLEAIDLEPIAQGMGLVDVSTVAIDSDVPLREVDGQVMVRMRVSPGATPKPWPYGTTQREGRGDAELWRDVPLIAYHDWANRGPSTMRVWLPRL